MSRKPRRHSGPLGPPAPARGGVNRTTLFVGAVLVLLVAFGVGALLHRSATDQSGRQVVAGHAWHLSSDQAPLLGRADARVHIVEFLDPACETCAAFYPYVKALMSDHPGRIRLSIRHVAFHPNAEPVVRMLETSRAQGKYREALEAVLATQDRWTVDHRVDPERVWPVLRAIGLDLDRVRRDMSSPEITARVERDAADARALGVTKTPEYFVNGRPLPRFGLAELQTLVREELRSAYR